MRNDSIGKYSWDNSGSAGYNDWSLSELQKVLNSGPYYNRTSGKCPYWDGGGTVDCNFSSTGLTAAAKNMIGKAKWYLGAPDSSKIVASQFYALERGNRVYTTTSKTHPKNWIGFVGLMYPSDYGYASGTSSCLATNLYVYNESCKNENWIFNPNIDNWTITPDRSNTSNIMYVFRSGLVTSLKAAAVGNYATPVVYLKASVLYTGGNGTSSSPYQISL